MVVLYNGRHEATEQGLKEHLKKRSGEGSVDSVLILSNSAGERWTWQRKTELNKDKWYVSCYSLGVTTHKSSKSSHSTWTPNMNFAISRQKKYEDDAFWLSYALYSMSAL